MKNFAISALVATQLSEAIKLEIEIESESDAVFWNSIVNAASNAWDRATDVVEDATDYVSDRWDDFWNPESSYADCVANAAGLTSSPTCA